MNNANGIACGIYSYDSHCPVSNEADQWSNPDRPNMQDLAWDLVLCVWLEARNLPHIAQKQNSRGFLPVSRS